MISTQIKDRPHPNRDAVETGTAIELGRRRSSSAARSIRRNHLVFFVSAVDVAATPEERRSRNRPTPLKKQAQLTNHNDNICTPVYASNVNTFPISTAHAAASAAATNPVVASRSLGTAAAEPPQPADCIARAARDICLMARRRRAALV